MPNVIGGTLKVGNIEIELPIIVVITQGDAHRSHDRSPGGYGHARAETDLFKSSVAFVVIEIGIEPIVGYKQVRPAIIVVVGSLHGKILTLWLIDPRLLGHVGERAVVIVVIQRVGASLIPAVTFDRKMKRGSR